MSSLQPETVAKLQQLEPYNFGEGNVRPADLAETLASDNSYVRSALTGDQSSVIGDSATVRHWRLMLPSPRHEYGLEAIEFGVDVSGIMGMRPDEVRFNQEMFVDEVLSVNETNPAIPTLFNKIGGFLVASARNHGHSVFAGIQVLYSPIEGNQTLQWAQLVYSKALLGTSKEITRRLSPNDASPNWLRTAALPRNKRKAAEVMAIGSLVAAEQL